jgi:hypothetical protein
MQFTDCDNYTFDFNSNNKTTYLYDYQDEIKYIERSTNLNLELDAKQLFDSFIDNFARFCRANYPVAHFKEELALLDKNYLSEPTFDYVKNYENNVTDKSRKLTAMVHSIHRACDKPQYGLAIQTESRVEGSLLCTFRSSISVMLDSGDVLRGTFATKICLLINISLGLILFNVLKDDSKLFTLTLENPTLKPEFGNGSPFSTYADLVDIFAGDNGNFMAVFVKEYEREVKRW